MRRLIIIAILCTWVTLLGVVARRQGVWRGTAAPPEEDALRLGEANAGSDSEEWLSVYQRAHKIGYTHQRLVAEADGFTFVQTSLLRLKVLDAPQVVRTTVRGRVGPDFTLRSIDFEMRSDAGILRAQGAVDGSTLQLTVVAGTERSERTIPLREPLYLASLLRTAIRADLAVGRRLDASVFDPTVLSQERVGLTVEAEEVVPGASPEVRGWRIREEFRGMQTTAWIDAHGAVLREEGPMGLTLVRQPPAEAVHGGWDGDTLFDVVAEAAVPVARPLEDPRNRASTRLRLSGILPTAVPSDDQQVWDGEVLKIARVSLRTAASYPLPYSGSDLAEYLKPSALLQSDHPRVQAIAREIVGGTTDAKAAAGRLNDWVYDNLRKVPTMSLPNALQVLDMMQGDCNEHAVLLATLARAVGMPARLVAGAVYLDGAFLYHAWAEVWLGRWVAIDPAMRQFPVDATHVKFAAGEPEEQMAMMEIIGRLQVEVLPDE